MNEIQLDSLIKEMGLSGFFNVIANLEVQIIRRALDLQSGNRNQTAAALRMNRTTLVEKLKKFDMQNYFKIDKEPII